MRGAIILPYIPLISLPPASFTICPNLSDFHGRNAIPEFHPVKGRFGRMGTLLAVFARSKRQYIDTTRWSICELPLGVGIVTLFSTRYWSFGRWSSFPATTFSPTLPFDGISHRSKKKSPMIITIPIMREVDSIMTYWICHIEPLKKSLAEFLYGFFAITAGD